MTARDIGRGSVAGLFLGGSIVHVLLSVFDTRAYEHFADGALFDFVQNAWADVFMAHPAVWALVIAALELTIGVLLLAPGRARLAGFGLAIAFHVALAAFAWGFWLWSIPVLGLLIALASAEASAQSQARAAASASRPRSASPS